MLLSSLVFRRPQQQQHTKFCCRAAQCNLAFKKLGIAPIVMSAGELESGNAGEPAKLIRQRYREASDVIKKGKLCSLFINDLDAGTPPAMPFVSHAPVIRDSTPC